MSVESRSFKIPDFQAFKDRLMTDLAIEQRRHRKENGPEKPKHNAFEVEDIESRENFAFVKVEDAVAMYDTSRGSGNRLMQLLDRDEHGEFPFGYKDLTEYFEYLFNKAICGEDNIWFLTYVTPDLEPIVDDSEIDTTPDLTPDEIDEAWEELKKANDEYESGGELYQS